jgi:hypothetical protein
MGMNEQEANEAIAAAMREIEELRRTGKLDEARKKGWAPLEAIYKSSTGRLTQWYTQRDWPVALYKGAKNCNAARPTRLRSSGV